MDELEKMIRNTQRKIKKAEQETDKSRQQFLLEQVKIELSFIAGKVLERLERKAR